MSAHTVAIIGTGPDPANPTVQGFAMGYRHAEAFENDERTELVACADIVPENAEAFAETFGLDAGSVYESYERMVDEVEPDVVSVCVPPALHERVVVDCARSGVVDAVHCEKPIAHTWASAQRTVQTCWRQGVQLTFNRQRRFAKPFSEAKRLLDDGEIGPLRRVEIGWGDFYDTGAHTIDLAGMFNGDRSAEWVVAQLDYREEDVRFGAHQENQMWAQWRYENGVHGVLSTGEGSSLVGDAMVLRGSDGELRIGNYGAESALELRRDGATEAVDVGDEHIHGTAHDDDRFGSLLQDRSVASVVDALEGGAESPLAGRVGLNTAEIIFAGYESVRRRGRVDLPLEADDNALEAMVDSGELRPESVTSDDD